VAEEDEEEEDEEQGLGSRDFWPPNPGHIMAN